MKKLIPVLIALALIFSASSLFAQSLGSSEALAAAEAEYSLSMLTKAKAAAVAQVPSRDPDRAMVILGIILLAILVIEESVTFIRSFPLLNKKIIRGNARKAKSDIAASPKRKKAGSRKKRSSGKKSGGEGVPEAAPAGASI